MIIEIKAVDHFGHDHQLDKTVGELSELIDAIVKYKLGECDESAVIDEIADVQVLLPQLIYILEQKTGENICKEVAKRRMFKLERLGGKLWK
ncbi:hypothetical protein VME_45850 [Vibrio harveyi 1DA3]|nr:hypothetical protein VME_45850 [Vibrio harveyi 1DA3]